MSNIATVLKEEIVRLARKEIRRELEALKKASGQYRTDIAGLKRRVAVVEKQLGHLDKKTSKKAVVEGATEEGTHHRFSAKRLATMRQKLGLTAAELGTLLGVSAQSVYNWEAGKSRPRQQQLAAIAVVRGMGKTKIKAQLASSGD